VLQCWYWLAILYPEYQSQIPIQKICAALLILAAIAIGLVDGK
jgi:hypothetical protein